MEPSLGVVLLFLCFVMLTSMASYDDDTSLVVLEDIERRVKRAGGSTGKLSVSLSWTRESRRYADLDLHLFLPSRLLDGRREKTDGYEGDVCYRKKENHHYKLDVDMCAGDAASCPHKPVENIVFPAPSLSKRKRRKKRVVPGKYSVVVRNFGYKGNAHGRNGKGPPIPFDVVLTVNGEKTLITGLCTKPNTIGKASGVRVVQFVVARDGSVLSMKKHKPMGDICRSARLLKARKKKRRGRIANGNKKKRSRRRRKLDRGRREL